MFQAVCFGVFVILKVIDRFVSQVPVNKRNFFSSNASFQQVGLYHKLYESQRIIEIIP